MPLTGNHFHMLEADMLQVGAETDIKIYDDVIMHHFRLKNRSVLSYYVNDRRGEPIAMSMAEVVADGDSLMIRTAVIDFEIQQNQNYRYMAYKKLRH